MKMYWPPVIAVVLFLVCWYLAAELFNIPSFILPDPVEVAREAWYSMDRIGQHAFATLKLTLLGFFVGCGVGIGFACVLHPIQWLKAALNPLIVISQNIPIIVLGPLLMTWFGFGLGPKVLVITLVCFFPVAIAMLNGLMQTDRVMMNYMRMIGASRSQIFFKLEFPHALPYLFAGLKISGTYSVMGAIMAEWIGTDKGIGKYLLLQQAAFRTDRMFISIAVIVLLSLVLFGMIALLEKLLIRWSRDNGR